MLAAALVAAIVPLIALACERAEPIIYRVPEVIGVVLELDLEQPEGLVWELAGGERLVVDRRSYYYLRGGTPTAGTLLLAGHEGGRQWVVGFGPTCTRGLPADCFDFFSTGTDEGATIALDVGLRLPKAPGFDPRLADNSRYDGKFCVNSRGEVTYYRGGRI